MGKLNHAAHVIPPARYFLNRLRHLMKRGKQWGPQQPQLWNRQDLQQWMKLLQHVTTKGVPISNIVFVKPSVTLWLDTCGYGIGWYRYNVLAWRWRIPSEWHGKLTFNLLEFLALEVTIYMTILQLGQGSHIVSFTDSSIVFGWMHKASFDPVNAESYYVVSR